MPQATVKTGSALKKRRIELSPEERAGLAQLKQNPAPVTERGRRAYARFLKFKKSNAGW